MMKEINTNEIHPDLHIVNMTATINLGLELDLDQLSADLNAQYEPDRYPSIVYRTENDVSFLIPRTGKVVIVGFRTGSTLLSSVDLFIEELTGLGLEPKLDRNDMEIKNIVATGQIGGELDLALLSTKLGMENTEYEPEQFPGLIYRLERTVVLLFSSGKIVITGGSSIDTINSSFQKIREQL